MHDRDIFTAVRELQHATERLADTVRAVLPQMADALRCLDEHLGGAEHGQAFARAYVDEVVTPIREALPALEAFLHTLDGELLDPVEPERPEPRAGINFERFRKLTEFCFVEKTIEVVAPLRDGKGTGLLRLEALRSPDGQGYEVAVYREMDAAVCVPDGEGSEPELRTGTVRVWTGYDLIRSVLPSAEKALEQVLAFLEMRCT